MYIFSIFFLFHYYFYSLKIFFLDSFQKTQLFCLDYCLGLKNWFSFDNIFLNIEYHLREIGHGDVVVNKKMKSLTRIFYDILIKMDKDNLKSFNMNENILKKYLEPEFSNDNEFIAKLSAYFENFYNFCFVLEDNIVLKGQINFKYK